MHIYLFNVGSPGTFLVVQWLSLCLLCRGTGSIPGWGTNSLHAALLGKKKVEREMAMEPLTRHPQNLGDGKILNQDTGDLSIHPFGTAVSSTHVFNL